MPRRHYEKSKEQLIQYIYELEAGSASPVVAIREAADKVGAIIAEICATRWGQSLGLVRWRRWKRELPLALAALRAAIGQKAE